MSGAAPSARNSPRPAPGSGFRLRPFNFFARNSALDLRTDFARQGQGCFALTKSRTRRARRTPIGRFL
jgi:hypothetical protein